MLTDNQIANHLTLSSRHVRDLRASGVLPPIGADLNANRLAYLRRLRVLVDAQTKPFAVTALETQRSRLVSAQADMIERQNTIAARELAPVDALKAAVSGMIAVARSVLLRVGATVSPQDADVRKRIDAAISDALQDLDANHVFPADHARRDAPS